MPNNTNDEYIFRYTPSVIGEHSVLVMYNDVHVAKSPYKVTV
jgi:hypothetical protein